MAGWRHGWRHGTGCSASTGGVTSYRDQCGLKADVVAVVVRRRDW
eukprot:COSAG05_NODE_12281_length_474_cov_1.309333_1_plen_44_part_01